MEPDLIELFVDGTENVLPDSGQLHELGLREGSVVFMLQRPGWRWTTCGSFMTLSGDGLVAAVGSESWQLATGGEVMTEGRRYWEVALTKLVRGSILVGATRPGLDHNKKHYENNGAYFINAADGALWGNGKEDEDPQGALEKGDRIGVLLDLDAGWLRFYRNRKRYGPGFTHGVTGPLVRATQFFSNVSIVTALPGADIAPGGAGAVDEPWEPAIKQ
jgi:hypothetical protein